MAHLEHGVSAHHEGGKLLAPLQVPSEDGEAFDELDWMTVEQWLDAVHLCR